MTEPFRKANGPGNPSPEPPILPKAVDDRKQLVCGTRQGTIPARQRPATRCYREMRSKVGIMPYKE